MVSVSIIGSGVAGIATAIRLRARGFNVTVYEQSEKPGGKLKHKSIGNYRFDLGPSLFTRPELVEELLNIDGNKPNFEYYTLETLCNYFFENGQKLSASSDKEAVALSIEKSIGEPKENILKYLDYSNRINKIAGSVFLENSLHKLKTYLKPSVWYSMLQIHKIDALRTMHKANSSFFKKQETVQLFNRYATYNGSNPYKAPATLNLISSLEFSEGAFLPKGGMVQITNSLYQKAEQLGVKFEFKSRVDKILVNKKGNKCEGIEVNGKNIFSDIVISNMDAYFTYSKLLKMETKAKKIDQLERSGSALIFYWGVKGIHPQLDVHNIFFSSDYQKEFEYQFEKQEVFEDPTVYIHISSKLINSDAPPNCENWFVMVNVPAKPELFTEENIKKIKQNIISKIEKNLGYSINENIEEEEILTPGLIEERTSSYKGALYGTSSNKKFSAFFRPANFTSQIKDLYFCGGSVHPGGGIPLCLLSAKIVNQIIK
jgi:phytoene desaturase